MVEQGNEKAGQSSVNTTEKRFTIIVPEAVTRFPVRIIVRISELSNSSFVEPSNVSGNFTQM